MTNLKCHICSKTYSARPSAKRKYCGRQCYISTRIGRPSRSRQWKGEAVSYRTLHAWVAHWRGKPKSCESCGTTSAKKFEWANISHQYKRDLTDWRRLCTSCHRIFDNNFKKGQSR